MKKKFFRGFLMVCILLFMYSVSVMADGTDSAGENIISPEEWKTPGSVTVILEDTQEGLSKEGVSFGAVMIADVDQGAYVLKDKFQGTEIDLSAIVTAEEMEKAAAVFREKVSSPEKIAKTDKNGVAVIENLPVGAYLIYAEDTAGYETVVPALVTIPTFEESEGVMSYTVTMRPKHSALSPKETADTRIRTFRTGIAHNGLEYAVAAVCFLGLAGMGFVKVKKDKR